MNRVISWALVAQIFFILPFAYSQSKIRVLVWDEQQAKQQQAYPNFLGPQIADHLRQNQRLAVSTAKLDDPFQGLSSVIKEEVDVLIWWGHVRHGEISSETARAILDQVESGRLGLIVLHSAHFSTVFMEAMAALTKEQVDRTYADAAEKGIKIEYLPYQRKAPKDGQAMAIEPWVRPYKFPDGRQLLQVQLPNCCFPAWRADGKPSHLKTLLPKHPIAKGIPAEFSLPNTEMYAEPFHVPDPGEVIFEEYWETGEWFRSGSVWNYGKGKIFYFRPGHETYKVFFEEIPLKILENATVWLGKK